MDVFTDPDPVTYREWVKFTLPDDAGGRTAIAVSATTARRITALYTIFILWIFIAAWNLVISLVLLFFTPEKMTRTSYIAVVAAWNANDPFQATLLMFQHIGQILKGMLMTNEKKEKYKAEFNFRNLLLDIAILVVASATFAGSITAGFLFPDRLTIGSSAPVNPDLMHYPVLELRKNGTRAPDFVKLNYASMGALRAFGAIEGSEVTILKSVNIVHKYDQSNWREARRYSIHYGYNVTGAQMGLQRFGKLTVQVQGTCTFADDWWIQQISDESGNEYDKYTLWKDNQPAADGIKEKSAFAEIDPFTAPLAYFAGTFQPANATKKYYSILPVVAGKPSVTESSDPWYETTRSIQNQTDDFPYQVTSKRPPLKCFQTDEWSYNGWKGSTSELLYGDQTPVKFPEGILNILESEFVVPMIVNIGRALQAGALKSSTRILPDRLTGIDAESSLAITDMKRIVLGAYLATRNIFRDAAMAGRQLGTERNNILKRADGKMLDGVGDVVIVSSVVSSLRLGYFAAIPAILVFLIIVNGLFKIGRVAFVNYDEEANPGRYSRFLRFLVGLHATQLYRMVDQILAQVDIQDERSNHVQDTRHRDQANWLGQKSALPRVSMIPNCPQTREELVLPQLRGVKVDDKPVLTLRATANEKNLPITNQTIPITITGHPKSASSDPGTRD
ncbi:hypothetical protein BGX38DRAFT_1283441 [Terfezia claveryi]|nr:hypothetical protein BGX38DRAFT_1283441 [Terfezia claveryi]